MTRYVLQCEMAEAPRTLHSGRKPMMGGGLTIVPLDAEDDAEAIARARTEVGRIAAKEDVLRWRLEQTRVLISEDLK